MKLLPLERTKRMGLQCVMRPLGAAPIKTNSAMLRSFFGVGYEDGPTGARKTRNTRKDEEDKGTTKLN